MCGGRTGWWAGAIAALLLSCGTARAGSIEVAPTTIELPARGGTAQLRLVNHAAKDVAVQIEAFAWRQEGAETLADSDDIVLNPPLARLKPMGSQIVRLLVQPAGGAVERAFRVVVTELPDPADKSEGMRVLLQFVVPLFAGDTGKSGARLDWSLRRAGTGLRVEVRNSGARRAKFGTLTLVSSKGERWPLAAGSLVYVLAGSTRVFALDKAFARPGETLHLEGSDADTDKRLALPLVAAD